ncbi:MAG: heavy metal translocating P-type ATPase [Fimbriimonadaceae bacterium]|nr:heavy metal translocating P-type ATPase [Chthonomonadaceae bacterium]MCO5296027.1 heavy metal translocating P-type ATPase [Fimbriimonadaceae bacterium]
MRWLRDPEVLLTVLCGLFTGLSFFHLHPAIAYLGVAFGSPFAVRASLESVRNRELDVNVLMVLAAIGAVVVGHPEDAAGLLFLFSLSSTLEHFAMAKTKSAIEGLIQLRPAEAIRVGPEGDERVPVEALRIGERVRVAAFDQIPVDGEVVEGNGAVDQSAMTGESVPVEKGVGDALLAGTQNLDRALVLEVTAEVGDTTLDKIVALVEDAQENKASGERISAWFGQRYTFFVVGAFVVAFAIRMGQGVETPEALYRALILLVALSPCAVVISTPATTLSALAWAARHGMLVRGGRFIESMGEVRTAALDKTGTLTAGKPTLAEICVCTTAERVGSGGGACLDNDACWMPGRPLSEEARFILRVAAAAEQYAAHPFAEAIVEAARSQDLDVPEAQEQRTHPGMGVTARVDGLEVRVGQRRFFEEESVRLPSDFAPHVEEIEAKGMTVAVVQYGDRYAALGLQDAPRPNAAAFVQSLRDLGFGRVAMLTGDTPNTAAAIAKDVGVDEVYAGLLPDDKTRLVDQWVSAGETVLMVGDGVNDAPALARANVGLAMGGLGSDIALNAADVVLMQDRLERIPELVRLGRKTNRVIRANLVFATLVIGTLAVSSMFFRLPLPLAVVGHEGSTVLVILNGLRLLRGA